LRPGNYASWGGIHLASCRAVLEGIGKKRESVFCTFGGHCRFTTTDRASALDALMASPQSGAEGAGAKLPKDRNCPFCGQAFTSSSLGRHLDLYIKSKNPKPPDGVHNVDEIRKLRGNITRRQSRVASIKRDSSVPAGPASARYSIDERIASTPDSLRRVNWSVNRPGWEATGVMNDLPPRLEPRPVDRRDSSKREQLKADLDQRQKLADELDTGRAAQLALKEILDTVRNAEASATGRHLFDEFDFFQQSFPALCLRLLSPSAQHDSSLVITANDSWSSTIPWDRQKDALSRVVEARGQFLRRKDSLLSTTYDETSSASINLDKFHDHITKVFDLWRSLPDRNRHDIWQREILRSYARMENDLKEARSTIAALKRDAELMSKRLSRGNNILSPAQGAFETSMQYTQSPISMSNDALKDLGRQGLSTREWEYERLLDRWKNIVREERRSSSGLQAQRNFATPSTRAMDAQGTLAINGARGSTASRSASVTSAMSAAAPTRTESIDSAGQDADAEGEEEDMEADNVAPDAHSYTRKSHEQNSTPQQNNGERTIHVHPSSASHSLPDPRLMGVQPPPQARLDQNYKWPQHQTAPMPPYQPHPDQSAGKRLPPGPDSWHAEFHHAVSHNMEGLEGPATTNAPTSVS